MKESGFNAVTVREIYLMIHIRSVHEGVMFPCGQCEKQFAVMFQLKTHIKAVH